MPKKPKPRKIRIDGMPDEHIGIALIACKGLQYLAAEMLGMDGGTISERIKKSPYLQALREEAVERRLDKAEKALATLVDDHSLGAICFLLKTKGKHRGYAENAQIVVSPETVSMMNSLMNQTQELQNERKKAQSST